MTDARGKLGGQVFTKTRSGATVRQKVTPTNPQTTAQMKARTILTTLSQQWKDLTETDRRSWNSSVESFSRTNVFGDRYNPSGKNLFVSLNAKRLDLGLPVSLKAPVPVDVPAIVITNIFVDTAAEEISMLTTSPLPGSGHKIEVWATRPSSAGRYNFSGKYYKIGNYGATALPASDQLYQDYVAKFGGINAGEKISFRINIVVENSGQSSVFSEVANIAE